MMKSASVAPAATRTSSVKVQASLRPAVRSAPKAAAPRANQMMVWQPVNNK